MKRISLLLLAVVALLPGCAEISEASLQDAVDGRAGPEHYVRAVVTDTRAADVLLVELTSGDTRIWASGFTERPGRGREVWTAFLDGPVNHELVGLVYPTAGELDPPEAGITDQGALGVLIGAIALAGVFVALLIAGLFRIRPRRRCHGCGAACGGSWMTCPNCGSTLDVQQAPTPRPVAATVFSAKDGPQGRHAAPDESGEAEGSNPVTSTRIVREDT